MTDESVIRVAVNVPLTRLFDYAVPAGLPVPPAGARVRVPFGRRRVTGVVVDGGTKSDLPASKLRRIEACLDEDPLLGTEDLWLVRFTADYYHHPIGEVAAAALPAGLRDGKTLHGKVESIATSGAAQAADLDALGRRAPRQAELLQVLLDAGDRGIETGALTEQLPNWRRAARGLFDKGLLQRLERRADDFDEQSAVPVRSGPELNDAQREALHQLRDGTGFRVALLDGVTGSGKTEVYLHRIRDVIDSGRQVLVLAPEIGLTPQLVQRFAERLGVRPALLHSALSDTARLAAWRAARSGAARLVVGTRSAVFTPLRNPGLIIVDEEHDPSYKQQEGLRYSARDLAIARAKHLGIGVILGSATPSLESLQHCRTQNFSRVVLPARAGGAVPPSIRLVDTQHSPAVDGLSAPLAEAIDTHLDAGGQVLLFLNRRGFAPTLICSSCGHVAECDRCDARLTVHARSSRLRCHHCGASRRLDERCGECGDSVRPLGEGTERLENAVTARYPARRIRRIDSDSTQARGAMTDALHDATDGTAEILVGTQMLSKGHHFPNLSLVGIVNADQGLFGTDFRSAERMAQAIVQVAGRAGREQRRGEVLIQTAFPGHDFWRALLDGGYPRLADAALTEREQTRWPPFSRLALLRAAAHKKGDAHQLLRIAADVLADFTGDNLRLLGPVDAPMARRAGRYRAHLLLQSTDRRQLHRALSAVRSALENSNTARRTRWSIDVDPLDLY